MGKFYELYHMDAVVGVRELGILFMRVCIVFQKYPALLVFSSTPIGLSCYSQITVSGMLLAL